MAKCKQQNNKQYAIDYLEYRKVYVNTIEWIIWREMRIQNK